MSTIPIINELCVDQLWNESKNSEINSQFNYIKTKNVKILI